MKALIMGNVVEGSRAWTAKDGSKRAELRVFDGSDVTAVKVDPRYVEGPEALAPGVQVRIPCLLRAWESKINAESLNGVEVVAGK